MTRLSLSANEGKMLFGFGLLLIVILGLSEEKTHSPLFENDIDEENDSDLISKNSRPNMKR